MIVRLVVHMTWAIATPLAALTDVFNPSTALGWLGPVAILIGVIAIGWATAKAKSAEAWKDAAGGYKAQNDELRDRIKLAEESSVALQTQVANLEKRPDMTTIARILEQHGEMLHEIARRIGDLSARRG